MNIYECLEAGFPEDRSQPCIEVPGDRDYTWAEVDEGVGRMANLLTSLNLEKDARVAVQVEKSVEALMLYLATVRAGFVYIPLNTAYRESEISYFLEDGQPSVVVCTPKNHVSVAPAAARAGVPHVFTLDDAHSGSLLEASGLHSPAFVTVKRNPEDPASIVYTSGTTGRSKGAMLSHGNLASNAQTLNGYWGWRSDDVLLHALPIFHVHGLFVASHGALLAGAKMIWLAKFDIDEVLSQLPRATVMMGVPTFYVRLLADPRFQGEVCRNMRLFISGSAPLLLETFDAFRRRSGHTILERYGMSETAMLVSNPYHGEPEGRIGGTVGLPLPGISVRVVDGNNLPVKAGEVGQIQVKGPNVFSGYWRMPEKTKEEFTGDRWFKTGDLGRWGGMAGERQVPDQYLCIVGRSKDLIISGGFNVYPKEIEGFIDDMPGVGESAVIGVPHPDFGEAVVAVVTAKPGAALDPIAMIADLKTHIANFKVPKAIHVVEELPRNTMGKVQKNILRNTYGHL